MKKKIFTSLLVVVMVLSLFAGCSGGSAPATTPSATSSAAPAETPSAAPAESSALAPASITVLCGFASEDPHGQYVYQYADAFSAANPGVTVEVQAISTNDIYTKLAAMATTPRDIPTLFYTSADQVATLFDLGLTQDLNDYLSDDVKNKLANGTVTAATLNNQMTFYPISVQPLGIIYRKDRFDEAGLSVPKTWDEFVACSKALTGTVDGEQRWGFSMVGSNNSSGQSRFMSYLWTHGFKLIYEEGGEWKTDISTDPAFMAAFTRWTDMNNVDKIVPTGITEVDYAAAATYIATEYTSIILTGPNALGISYSNNPGLKGKLASFMLPGDYPGTMLNAEGYAMSAHASEEQKQAAAAFLQFFSENDPEMKFWNTSGKIPATLKGQEAEYITGDDYKGYLDQIASDCLPTVTFPGINGLKSALGNAYSAVFSGEKTNEQAVQELIVAVDDLLKDYN